MAGYVVTVVSGVSAGAAAAVSGGSLVVGRDPSCDLVINDAKVSRNHLRITDHGHYASIEDLGSTNGTTVNGRSVAHVALRPGDAIRVGDSEITLAHQPQAYAEPTPSGRQPQKSAIGSWIAGFASALFIVFLAVVGLIFFSISMESDEAADSPRSGSVEAPDYSTSAPRGPSGAASSSDMPGSAAADGEGVGTPGPSDIVEDLSPSVVQIFTPFGVGTGFVVDEGDRVITNAHVVDRLTTVGVRSSDGQTHRGAVLGVDEVADLALIRLERGPNLKAAALGDSDTIRVGDEVIAMGFPMSNDLGNSMTVTRGIVSAKRSSGSIRLLQTDAAINPGNSGGPLIGPHGRVVGINTEKLFTSEDGRPVEGISIAVSINDARDRFDSLARGDSTLEEAYGASSTVALSAALDGFLPSSFSQVKSSDELLGFGLGFEGQFRDAVMYMSEDPAQVVIAAMSELSETDRLGMEFALSNFHLFKDTFREMASADPDMSLGELKILDGFLVGEQSAAVRVHAEMYDEQLTMEFVIFLRGNHSAVAILMHLRDAESVAPLVELGRVVDAAIMEGLQ